MTALQTTVPPMVDTLILSTVLPPEIVCAMGFIWVVELAACKLDNNRLQPRKASCPVGFHFRVKFNQCIRMKYHPKRIPGPWSKRIPGPWSRPSGK